MSRQGQWVDLSPARKMVVELLTHAQRVPTLPLSKQIEVTKLAQARRGVEPAPSWYALFMRAYGLASQKHPELRRAYIPWPWAHLYEHPESECAVLVERDWQGEPTVLGAKIRGPEKKSLSDLDAELFYFKNAPVLEVSSFRQILRLGRLPWLVRRFVFWQTLYLSGFKKAKRFGTFMLSSLGNLGVEQQHPLTPLTTYFTFGPISVAGEVTIKLIYDHRVLDGRCAARCLGTVEELLHTKLLDEVVGLQSRAA